jgi:hypothetical protein
MPAMMEPKENLVRAAANGGNGPGMQRLQFELALDLSVPGVRPVKETLAHAAETAGVDLLFVLPTANGKGTTAVVRMVEEGSDAFLQVRTADDGFAVSDEKQMDKALLQLARTSLDVLRRMSADSAIREPLAAPA